jgi:hypothetical protein
VAVEVDLTHWGGDLEGFLAPLSRWRECDRGRQAPHHRGKLALGADTKQAMKGSLESVLVDLSVGKELLQDGNTALPEVLRGRTFSLDWESVGGHERHTI